MEELPRIRFSKDILAEEYRLLEVHKKQSEQTPLSIKEKMGTYYLIEQGFILFKEVVLCSEVRSGYVFYNPTLMVKKIFRLTPEIKAILPEQKRSFLNGIEFTHIFFLTTNRWYALIDQLLKLSGKVKTYQTHIDYKKYLRMKRWTCPRFLFYLIIYHEWRNNNTPKKQLADYYDLTPNQINRITSIMFDLYCNKKDNCVFTEYYVSQFKKKKD